MRADEIAALVPHMTAEQRAEYDAIIDADDAIWRAQPGPQSMVLASAADIIGFGGSAGGGKSDLLCGLVLTEHRRSVIFRREKAQTQRIVQRLGELRGSTGLNSQTGIWQLGGGRLLELGGLDNPGDEMRWQGRDHDLKAYDEATEMREAQVRFTMGWARSADPTQRIRRLLTFNPPTTPEGRWVIKFFGPWLDDKHPNPAKDGELRWFTTISDNQDFEVPNGDPFVLDGAERVYDYDPDYYVGALATLVIRPLSRTFIKSRVTDNPWYSMTPDYISTLQALPEPLRSQMLDGDFNAGVEDDPWQLIPTGWIDASMAKWKPADQMPRPVGPMDSMGVDVAAGGRDKEVVARRHGHWVDQLSVFPGEPEPNGALTGSRVMSLRRDNAVVHVDIIGPGGPTHGFLAANGIQSVGVNSAAPSYERAKAVDLKFFNLRSEICWRVREALDPNQPEPLILPPDPALRADLASMLWSHGATGIRVESKVEAKKRLGRSPDRGDAVIYAVIPTPKRAVIDALMRRVTSEHDPFAVLN